MPDTNAAIWDEVQINIQASYESTVAVNPGIMWVLVVTESSTEMPLPGQTRVNARYLVGWVEKALFPQITFDEKLAQVLLLPLGGLFYV